MIFKKRGQGDCNTSLEIIELKVKDIFDKINTTNLSTKEVEDLSQDIFNTINTLEAIKKSLIEKEELEKTKISEQCKIKRIEDDILALITLSLTVFSPIIGIPSLILTIKYCSDKAFTLEQKKNKIFLENKELMTRINSLKTSLEDNKTKATMLLIDKTEYQENPITKANSIIEDYLSNNVLPSYIHPSIEETIIKLLQSDLDTDEENLIVLLNLTKQKIDKESLSKTLVQS